MNKTILINGVEVPAPETKPLQRGKIYWTLGYLGIPWSYYWVEEPCNYEALTRGLVWLKEEHAQQAFAAMIKPLREYMESNYGN